MLTKEQREEIEREARENAMSFFLGAMATILVIPVVYLAVMFIGSLFGN
jgi:hypothetical protein